MLLRATARRRPSLSPSARHQQRLGPRVGDEDAPLGVGEQDGVGHGVEQRALAAQPPVSPPSASGCGPAHEPRPSTPATQRDELAVCGSGG